MYIERKDVRPAFKALALLPLPLRRRILYALYQRKWLHLRRPTTYSEKVNWRIVKDRRDILVTACDKEASKELAKRAADGGLRVPQTYWFGTDLNELTHAKLPDRWVLKPNSGSGRAYFGTGRPNVDELKERTSGWLDDDLSAIFGAWAYSKARRAFLVEEQIGSNAGGLVDTKVFCFDGKPELIQVVGRVDDRLAFSHYSPEWKRLDLDVVSREQASRLQVDVAPPSQLDLMLSAASELSRDYDFLRVDMYDVDGEVWFGELTCYPSGGVSRFSPRDADEHFGSLWILPAHFGM